MTKPTNRDMTSPGGRKRSRQAPLSLLGSNTPEELGLPGGVGMAEPTWGQSVRPEPENELFLPVHGFVDLLQEEVAVLNHPALQRLGSVFQLGQSHLVFRGATHMRLEHVIGTVAVAQGILDALFSNRRRAERRGELRLSSTTPWDEALTPLEEVYTRLGALLHDVGHLPAGHTIEDELALLDKHDELPRLELIFQHTDWASGPAPPLRQIIDDQYSQKWALPDGLRPSDLALQLIAKSPDTTKTRALSDLGIRVNVCRDIIGNTICADLLDYLHRDWHHIGKPKYFDKRLFQYMEIRRVDGSSEFVISLGNSPKLRTDAITAILSLLESRYELAETVLFHRTKCAAAAMLERGIYEIQREASRKIERKTLQVNWKQELVLSLLSYSDESALAYIIDLAKTTSAAGAHLPLRALRQRRLYRMVSTTFRDDFKARERTNVQRLYSGGAEAAERRNQAMRALEQDFELPSGSLAMYCPEKGMNSKIALVKVHADGRIAPFETWDGGPGGDGFDELSGGHIRAQLARFHRLWRVHVAIDRDVWEGMDGKRRDALRRAVRVCVLGQSDAERTINDEMRAIALLMKDSAPVNTAFYGRQISDSPKIAAVGGSPQIGYPTGANSLYAFRADNDTSG